MKNLAVVKPKQKDLNLIVKKNPIKPPVDIEDIETISKEALEIEIPKQTEPKNFNLTNAHITKWLHKTNQTGWQNKSIEKETLFPNENASAAKNIKTGVSKNKSMNINQEYTNNYMEKSKFGHNPNVPENATTNAKIQTFGASDTTIENRQKNGCESDYGYSGWLGNSLWASDYINSDGVGKFK